MTGITLEFIARRRHLLVIAALLVATPAMAASGLPPTMYDRPYKGRLTIETVANAIAVRAICGVANVDACAFHGTGANIGTCRIILPRDKVGDKLLLRHELGHCNGWPNHHPGIRPYPQPVYPQPVLAGGKGPTFVRTYPVPIAPAWSQGYRWPDVEMASP